ncbi:sodium-dependent nutrient amino acid transporter 1-like isoform X1 [Anopheles albimanus]|uniref:sodium-dependent nutrient amino acid transporter 1-like isoform X1 n=1 Tax=Anopheles albimanus TaxID=7167 RepID=UPI00164201B9|nr:sodium-dependent nutrient amino acid transporter 1-like isoform X1 [Anopheles albimanus]
MEGRDNNAFIGDSSPSIAGQFRWNGNTATNGTTLATSPPTTTPTPTTSVPVYLTELTDVELNGGAAKPVPDGENPAATRTVTPSEGASDRDQWGKGIEFLMSCIAMSVGLGNVWRFPFVALENGGGAFVIPYIIVLLLVGKPVYYMEMILGQFSSRGSVKVYDMAPIMRGVGFGQLVLICTLITYYGSLMALISRYMFDSFLSPLPWAYCRTEWLPGCVDAASKADSGATVLTNPYNGNGNGNNGTISSSSEWYFTKIVLKELDGIDDGIGLPDLRLTLFLVLSWSLVLLTLIKGVKSSGKASYFLALFPYVVMTVLLIRACTLPGAVDGIIYFLKPQWDKILDPKVWYAAVTQCFFSLSICFGNIIMYSSYNKFRHNVYRDATIVTSIDTFTSLLAGCTIFGILGHLAHVTGSTDVGSVVKSDAGLAFISYPEAIAKFEVLPQAFSVLFFLMLFVLGIGSNVAMTSCVMTVIKDQFPRVRNWQAATVIAVSGVLLGSIYVTPGGQYILKLVDYYGASSIALVLAIAELIAIGWVYGVDRLCKDTEFMLGHRPNLYWRLCWRWITPALMLIILIYNLITLEPLMYKQYVYPTIAYDIGWCIFAFGLLQLPIWATYAVYKQGGKTLTEKIKNSLKPTAAWGPLDPATHYEYKKFIDED